VTNIEYTINTLAKMAGISTRTLRYYDEINLLKPCRINSSGYRIYGEVQVDILQQILFYRALGIGLSEINALLHSPSFNRLEALKGHLGALKEKQKQIGQLIDNVNKTILKEEGKMKMSDKEKFEGLKTKLVQENEKKYGKEIRNKFEEDTIKESHRKFMNLSAEEYHKMEQLGKSINQLLEKAVAQKEAPEGESGQQIARMHKEWLSFTWSKYSNEAHAGLVQAYVDDERFTAYYDGSVKGCAKFLKDCVLAYIQTFEDIHLEKI